MILTLRMITFRPLAIYALINNTRVYNLTSAPQITWLSLGGAIFSSKTDSRNVSNKEKSSNGKFRNSKTMLTILSFIRVLYLKQSSNILRCFFSLKFEKILFNNEFSH